MEPTGDIGVIGLAVMGQNLVLNMANHGHSVAVYNRTPSKAGAWVTGHGGRAASTPCEAAQGAEFVFACVGNDDDLRAVVLGAQGALAGMSAGAVFVDHTTASAAVARELYAAATGSGLQFVEAPVSGGQAGAVNGTLTVMCGGDEAAFSALKPVARITSSTKPSVARCSNATAPMSSTPTPSSGDRRPISTK